MPPPQKVISNSDAKDALLRSGYLLEARTEALLREKLGYVQANASYQDPETGKSRELDLYAMSAHRCGPGKVDFIFGVLLIECINNPQPMALLTKEPLVPFLHHEEIKIAGLPAKIKPRQGAARGRWQTLMDFLDAETWHHYCKGRIATQYCSFVEKGGGNQRAWMATHEGGQFDAIRKLCDAADYYRQKHFRSWRFAENEPINLEVYYPVVVLQGELLDARAGKRSVGLRKAKHLQLRRSTATAKGEVDYQIDAVQEKALPAYLDLVVKELEKAARLMRRRHAVVQTSLEAIVREARRLRLPEKIQAAMA
jgi:hypothetical protein